VILPPLVFPAKGNTVVEQSSHPPQSRGFEYSPCRKYQGPYSHDFIFFVTYYRADKAKVSCNTWLERLARDKCSSLLGPLVGYKENEVS
jgi:hypothetical protein